MAIWAGYTTARSIREYFKIEFARHAQANKYVDRRSTNVTSHLIEVTFEFSFIMQSCLSIKILRVSVCACPYVTK